MLLSTILACLALNVSCAFADGTSPPTANGATAPDPNFQIVCKDQPPPLGTRIGGGRVCKTRIEWAAQEGAARTMFHDAQDQASINPGSGRESLPGGPTGRH
jgi:hypothetical protein